MSDQAEPFLLATTQQGQEQYRHWDLGLREVVRANLVIDIFFSRTEDEI